MSDSYARGDTSAPLIDETIGANLELVVARFGERERLISGQGRRYSYAELGCRRRRAGARADRRRAREGGPDRDLEPQLRGVDDRPVRHRQGRRDPVDVNPAYRTRTSSSAPVGPAACLTATVFKTTDYRAMVEGVRRVSLLRAGRVYRLRRLGRLLADAGEVLPETLRATGRRTRA